MGPVKEGLFLDLGRSGGAEELLKRFPPPRFFVARVDGGKIAGKAELMEALASAFRFPAYFGRNWDALLDCLRSLPDEVPAEGYVLAVENSALFLSASAGDKNDFSEVAEDARAFLEEKYKVPFVIALL
jgi:RNAse (barnase) inhibitor barstar